MRIRANCAARTMIADIKPIAEIQQRTGVPIECGAFIGSSPGPSVRGRLGARLPAQVHRRGHHVRRQQGLTVMYVTEDTTRADPESLRLLFTTAIRAGASRLCIADTVGHATPNGAKGRRAVREVGGRGSGRG
jgi:2-isopropylmalate synthase